MFQKGFMFKKASFSKRILDFVVKTMWFPLKTWIWAKNHARKTFSRNQCFKKVFLARNLCLSKVFSFISGHVQKSFFPIKTFLSFKSLFLFQPPAQSKNKWKLYFRTPCRDDLYKVSLYRASLNRDSLYRDSLYREFLHTESLYSESLYRESPCTRVREILGFELTSTSDGVEVCFRSSGTN